MSKDPGNPVPRVYTITAEETYKIRRPVLRPGRPPEECIFEGDDHASTLHLGIFLGKDLAGVASFMENKNPLFEDPVQFQLRGMAILPRFQYQNLGKELLLQGEKLLKKQFQAPLLWFNARESAIGFYAKYGYETKGELFMVPQVCMHIIMFKNL